MAMGAALAAEQAGWRLLVSEQWETFEAFPLEGLLCFDMFAGGWALPRELPAACRWWRWPAARRGGPERARGDGG